MARNRKEANTRMNNCSLCNGTGKLPIKDYAFGFYNCSCSMPEYGTVRETKPSDFDFACSGTFRSFYSNEPQLVHEVAPRPAEQVIVHRHSNMAQEESKLLQDTARGLQRVGQTLKEHLNYRKSGRYENYGTQ